MSEKLKFIKATAFAADNHRFDPQDPNGKSRSAEIFVPVDAIAFLTIRERGNPHGGYAVHFKRDAYLGAPFPTKSINPAHLTREQVEILG